MINEKTEKILKDYAELEKKLSDPEVLKNMPVYQRLIKEHSVLKDCVVNIKELKIIERDLLNVEEILRGDDKDLAAYAKNEKEELETKAKQLTEAIEIFLNPGDKNDSKNVIMEIRAGTGGDEAALFAGDLFRMYTRFAERRGWKVDVISASQTGLKGIKEVIFNVQGPYVYKILKYESGVHRVQRVPVTEASGRIHTSAITVAVLPEMDEVDVGIKNEDLRIDTFCSSGAGGQSVNTTYSAIRITHIPTGIVVQCQDERSQQRNKQKAMMVLRSKLMEKAIDEQQSSVDANRKKQVGTGDRSEKIRTYNFPQDRLTDHRVGLNFHNLKGILDGEIDDLVNALATEMNKKA